MRKVIGIVLLILLVPWVAVSAPNISGVSGTYEAGQTITIAGSGFGSHSLAIETLHDTIESGTVGQQFSKYGWNVSDWSFARATYANDQSNSGDKSLKCSLNSSSAYNCVFAYDNPGIGASQKYYTSWWVRYTGSGLGQWKMLRLGSNRTIVDNNGETVFFNWLQGSAGSPQINAIAANGTGTGLWPSFSTFPGVDNKWYRFEMEFTASSAGGANGIITARTTTDTGTIYQETFTGVRTHSGTQELQWTILQNYIGNGINSATIWFDDVYLQHGSPARVELCNGSTWNNRGRCEIQVPTTWGTSSISAKMQTGQFAAESTKYLYVVDSTGSVNTSGYSVTLGGSVAPPPDTSPPVRSAGSPSGILAAGTTSTTMSLTTDEAATCKYSVSSGTVYASMLGTFSTTGGMTHSTSIGSLQDGQSYTRYVRCIDGSGNANTTDYSISWSIAAPEDPPPEPECGPDRRDLCDDTNCAIVGGGWWSGIECLANEPVTPPTTAYGIRALPGYTPIRAGFTPIYVVAPSIYNIIDGGDAFMTTLNIIDGGNATASPTNIIDGGMAQ